MRALVDGATARTAADSLRFLSLKYWEGYADRERKAEEDQEEEDREEEDEEKTRKKKKITFILASEIVTCNFVHAAQQKRNYEEYAKQCVE